MHTMINMGFFTLTTSLDVGLYHLYSVEFSFVQTHLDKFLAGEHSKNESKKKRKIDNRVTKGE
jgi:hypothetical protein